MIKPALYQLTSAFSILNTDFFNCILSRYHYHTHVLTPNTYIRIVQYCREGAYTYTSQFEVQTMAICLNALLGEGASMSLLRVLYSFFQTFQISLTCLFDTGRREGRLLRACAMLNMRWCSVVR